MMRYMARRRAPRREGHRTTLTIPGDLLSEAADLAAELGTTTNDALVRLAEDGTEARRRRQRAQRLADERRAAVARVWHDDDSAFPDANALRVAMLGGRDGGAT